jgi:hypothetical protein
VGQAPSPTTLSNLANIGAAGSQFTVGRVNDTCPRTHYQVRKAQPTLFHLMTIWSSARTSIVYPV